MNVKRPLMLSLLLVSLQTNPVLAQQQQVISEASQLPRLTYRLPTRPSRLINDHLLIKKLAIDVDRQTADLLNRFAIRDQSKRRDLYNARTIAALVRGDLDTAADMESLVADGKAPRLSYDLLITALRERAKTGQARHQNLSDALRNRLSLRLADEREKVVSLRRELALASNAYRIGEIKSFADPEWKRNPVVGQDFAVALLRLWTEVHLRNPEIDLLEQELIRWLERHPDDSADFWKARDAQVKDDNQRPVTIAIWDGIDTQLFNTHLPTAGDNILAFDENFEQTSGALMDIPAGFRPKLRRYERYMRGIGDLAAGLDSADADFARTWRRSLRVRDVKAFEQGYGFYTNYIHGTHVAGVATRDLKRATIVPVRITFIDKNPPSPLDESAAQKFSDMVAKAVNHMRRNGVRLCNISWGFTPQDIEDNLSSSGAESDPSKRAVRAQKIFETMLRSMKMAMQQSPDILFVVSAGNGGQNVEFAGDLPGTINLPNVLTVGAADEKGNVTEFASTGSSVDLYALGTNILSVVPGGGQLRWSGASLAAPQVVNAAAKLLMVQPELKSDELAQLLVQTAASDGDSEIRLLNLKAAMAQLAVREKEKR